MVVEARREEWGCSVYHTHPVGNALDLLYFEYTEFESSLTSLRTKELCHYYLTFTQIHTTIKSATGGSVYLAQ